MSKAITIQIPDDVLPFWETENRLVRTLSYLSVVELVREGKLSAGKASELLELTRWELMDLLARHDVPTVNFSKEELEQQLADAIKGQRSQRYVDFRSQART
jgi:predicted HTH domain antitoxin